MPIIQTVTESEVTLQKELQAQAKSNWLSNTSTKKFLSDLMEQRNVLLDQCENLSTTSPIDVDQIKFKLAQSKKIKDIITYATKLR